MCTGVEMAEKCREISLKRISKGMVKFMKCLIKMKENKQVEELEWKVD